MSVEPLTDARLPRRLDRWCVSAGVDPASVPASEVLRDHFEPDPCRSGADPVQVAGWESRHGFRLPRPLRAWLLLSDGFYKNGPLIHPLTAIGPMVPFARVPGLVVQPESWFELGNPGVETVCIDLGYRWPGGDCPIFTSGDDERLSPPRLIASSFLEWFLGLLREGGREFWHDPGFAALGDPWREHRRQTPVPPLPERLRAFASRLRPLMRPGADDRSIAKTLGISRSDVEAIFRHLQHVPPRRNGT